MAPTLTTSFFGHLSRRRIGSSGRALLADTRGFFTGNQDTVADVRAACEEFGLRPLHLYAVEHVSLIFNRRRARMEAIPVFAAELDHEQTPRMTWEHSEFVWTDAEGVRERVAFRGLLEGLDWTRRYISEVPAPLPEFLLS